MLLYERQEIDLGVILTLDEMACQRWQGGVKSHRSARASAHRLVDFLRGDYSSVARVPLWCIGIEQAPFPSTTLRIRGCWINR
jgi:hypothetical protein